MNKLTLHFELLLVKDLLICWEVIGITYSDAMPIEPTCSTLRASLYTIEICKLALHDGKKITISKVTEYSEVLPHDLVIEQVDELSKIKRIYINEIAARMHLAIFTVNVIDLMDYLNCYINLLNSGYYITDKNREDKYFEIIEASLEIEEPKMLDDNATFEEESNYIEQKQKYDNALNDLLTLEKYLNAYDKLTHIKHVSDFLTETRKKIENCESIDDANTIINIFRSNLKNYKMIY